RRRTRAPSPREPYLRFVIEVRARHVQELLRLFYDRADDVAMRVAGRVDGDAGGAVEKNVPVHVLDGRAVTARDDQRIPARVRGRHDGLIARDERLGLRTRQRGDDVRRYFRFQRVPPALSSSSTPRAASSWRMRSAAAKSRRSRAAWRCSMNWAISSTGTGGRSSSAWRRLTT